MYQKFLTKILGIFDIPSGPIVGLWSLLMLLGCTYSIYRTHEVSPAIAMMFSTIIGAFAGHKIVTVWAGKDQNSDDTKDIDVQGDDNANKPTK